MKRTTIAASILVLAAVAHPVAAQDLAVVAAQPAVIADARTSPDGCAVRVLPDGGFMVFGTGSGTYSFNDEDDIAKARQAAQLAAKANLARFMKEKISTESALEESSKMAKSISSKDGETEKTIDKEMARKTMQTIRTSADALLQGVVALSEAKVPGEGTGGEIRVVCGVSSKTLEAHRRLTGTNTTPVDDEPPPTPAPEAPTTRSNVPDIDLLSMPDGVAVRLPPAGGFIILSAASAAYDTADEEEIQQAHRNAEAYAKAELARFMKEQLATESALNESAKMVKNIKSKDDSTSTTTDKETARATLQTIKASADALLKGVAAFADAKVPKEKGGAVRVLVGVTSDTLKARKELGALLGEVETKRPAPPPDPTDPALPAPALRKPTVRSNLPAVDILSVPDGVAVLVPPEGGFFVLSAATATYDFGDPDDTLQAKRNAETQAKAELAKFMKEKLATESSVDESAGMVKSMNVKDGKETETIDKDAARKTLQTIKTSADALLQGVATYADANIPGNGKGGEMRVLVGVSSKTMDALGQLEKAWGVSRAPGNTAPATGSAQASASASATVNVTVVQPAAPEQPAQPGADDWVECVGTGKSRPNAIRAALIEGVSMVYGAKLSQDNVMKIKYETFKNNGKTSSSFEQEGGSSILSATAGFVRQYRVVTVKTLDDGLLEATVRAFIVNPRAKAIPAVFVAPMHVSLADKTKNFQLGPKVRLSGGELATKLEGELADALAAANRFVVLSGDSIGKTAASGDLSKAMVEGGLAPATELLAACEASTADYVLGSSLQDAKWTSKVGLDKSTGKFGPQRKLSIRAKVRLTDVRAARAVASEDIVVNLDEEEIAMILGEDEDADLLFYVLKKIAPTVEEWIASVK